MQTALFKSIYNYFFGKRDEDKPYRGDLAFNRRTVIFFDTVTRIKTCVQLKNVSKFELYGLKFKYSISTLLLVVAGVIAAVSLYYNSNTFALPAALVSGVIVFIGVRERLRPKLYGLTIQLNSGTKHFFLSKDLNGIEGLFGEIAVALESDAPVMKTYHFGSGAITHNESNVTNITNSTVFDTGDHTTIKSNQF